MSFYDGAGLLSQKDLNGNIPELYLTTTNRSGGKTTYFSRLLVNKFNTGRIRKFGLIYRYNYELDGVADKFYKDIQGLFFPGTEMTNKRRAAGIYHELFINDAPCGYAFALNSADQLKKYSHLFSDTDAMFMDEFQSETNHYCSDEVRKFISLHTTIARGQGKQVRYVPVYMCSNPVSLINPYYTALKISARLREDTHYLRGNGFVLEQGFVESASQAQKESAFNQAFANDSYVSYATQATVYLNDNKAFIEKPTGQNRYVCTLRYGGCDYGIRQYSEDGVIYCDDTPDRTCTARIAVDTPDHQKNYVMLKQNDLFLQNLRYYFERGCFRFKDLKCKEAVLEALSY